MIVAEHVRQAFAPHRLHGNTVRKTVLLIQTGFVERQAPKKRGVDLRDDRGVGVGEHSPSKQRGSSSRLRRSLAAKGEEFGEHLIGSIEMMAIKGAVERLDTPMPLVPTIGQRKPIERVDEEPSHVGRFGVP